MDEITDKLSPEAALQLARDHASRLRRFAVDWQDTYEAVAEAEDLGDVPFSKILVLDVFYIARVLVSPKTHSLDQALVRFFSVLNQDLRGTGTLAEAEGHLRLLIANIRPEKVNPFRALCAMLSDFPTTKGRSATADCVPLFTGLLRDASSIAGDPLISEKVGVLSELLFAESLANAAGYHAACSMLNISVSFTAEELKTAYRTRTREWHPDRLEGMAPELKELATAKLSAINVAHETLQALLRIREAQGPVCERTSRSLAELRTEVRGYVEQNALPDDNLENEEDETSLPYEFESGNERGGGPYGFAERKHPVANALFILVVLAIVGFFVWGVWTDRPQAVAYVAPVTASQSAAGSSSSPSPVMSPNSHAETVSEPSVTPALSQADSEAASTSDAEGVQAEIRAWADDMTSNDADRMSSHYSEHVERYFLQKDLTRTDVRTSMADWLAQGNKNLRFEISDPVVHLDSATRASVRLQKSADIQNASGDNLITVRSEMIFILIDGQWRISSNRDFK